MTRLLQSSPSRRMSGLARSSPGISVRRPVYRLQDPIRRSAAILFVDLAGFTGASERVGLEGTHAMLAAFYRIVDTTVLDAGGLVLNYHGDGALIAFTDGSPRDAASRAAQVALDLVERVANWISLQGEWAAPAGVRIGAHLGHVLVARLGNWPPGSVTIIGDDVNVASRLLELASSQTTAIVFSRTLLEAAGSAFPRAAEEHLGPGRLVPIRGRSGQLVVHSWSRPDEPASCGKSSRA